MISPIPILPAYKRNCYEDPILQEHYVCLGFKIATLRRSLGISQRQLSEFAGISRSYLSKLEQGCGIGGVSLEVLLRIAHCLHMPISQLLHFRVQDYQLCNKQLARQHRL